MTDRLRERAHTVAQIIMGLSEQRPFTERFTTGVIEAMIYAELSEVEREWDEENQRLSVEIGELNKTLDSAVAELRQRRAGEN